MAMPCESGSEKPLWVSRYSSYAGETVNDMLSSVGGEIHKAAVVDVVASEDLTR